MCVCVYLFSKLGIDFRGKNNLLKKKKRWFSSCLLMIYTGIIWTDPHISTDSVHGSEKSSTTREKKKRAHITLMIHITHSLATVHNVNI